MIFKPDPFHVRQGFWSRACSQKPTAMKLLMKLLGVMGSAWAAGSEPLTGEEPPDHSTEGEGCWAGGASDLVLHLVGSLRCGFFSLR